MKTLFVPIALILLCAACSKSELPTPLGASRGNATDYLTTEDARTDRAEAAARISGDTIIPRISRRLGEGKYNEFDPITKRPEKEVPLGYRRYQPELTPIGDVNTLARESGDTIKKKLTLGESKPLPTSGSNFPRK